MEPGNLAAQLVYARSLLARGDLDRRRHARLGAFHFEILVAGQRTGALPRFFPQKAPELEPTIWPVALNEYSGA